MLSLEKIPKMLTNSSFVCLFVFQSLKGQVFIDQLTFTTFSVWFIVKSFLCLVIPFLFSGTRGVNIETKILPIDIHRRTFHT